MDTETSNTENVSDKRVPREFNREKKMDWVKGNTSDLEVHDINHGERMNFDDRNNARNHEEHHENKDIRDVK